MSSRVLPAVFATFYAVVFAVLLFVPYVAREYRRRGELGAWTAVLRFAALLYLCGLVDYVLSPLPPITPGFCRFVGEMRPQWEPLRSFRGVRPPDDWDGVVALLAHEPVQQFALNIALFVPLGILVRRLLRRGVLVVGAIGFATSLLIELTQLTGVWGVYPCPYRLFDVDDLIANTSGAVLGRFAAPALRLLPARPSGLLPTQPRPVTRFRRLTGMCCDLLVLWWVGSGAAKLVDIGLRTGVLQHRWWLDAAALWFGPALFLLLVAEIGASSPGQHAVRLRPVSASGRRPGPVAVLRRWLVGVGGLALVQGVLNLVGLSSVWLAVTAVWCLVHAVGVFRNRDHRGISGRFAGLHVVDAREPRPQPIMAAAT